MAELTNGSKIVLIIEYDGTNYHGSQYQTNALTIQEEIEKALKELTGKRTRIRMASRTDAGVHAAGQVASFTADSVLPMESYTEGLNHFLPEDISVKEVFAADESSVLLEGTLTRCIRCNTWFAARPGVKLCLLCEARLQNPFGTIIPPGLARIRPNFLDDNPARAKNQTKGPAE